MHDRDLQATVNGINKRFISLAVRPTTPNQKITTTNPLSNLVIFKVVSKSKILDDLH